MSDSGGIYFLINPRSGGKKAAAMLAMLRSYRTAEGEAVAVEELDQARSEEQVARAAAAAETVVVGGGDGTIASILQLLEPYPVRAGILPLGTGNDLARELGLARDFSRSGSLPLNDTGRLIEFYRGAPARRLSIWDLEYGEGSTRRAGFVNYVSFGFDARVVAEFSNWRTRPAFPRGVWTNRAGYALACLKNLHHRFEDGSAIEVSSDNVRHTITRGRSIIFPNIRSVMGVGLSNRQSCAFDDRIECVVASSVLDYLGMLARCGLPYLRPRLIGSDEAWELTGLPRGVHVQIDGEPRPDIEGSTFRIRRRGSVSVVTTR